LHGALGVRVRRVGAHEAVLAFERLGRALESIAHQTRGHQAVQGGPANLMALGPGAVGEELQAAGCLGQNGAKRASNAISIHAENPCRSRGGAESTARGGGMVAAVIMLASGQCQCDTAGNLVSGDDGSQNVGA
jgi:hypothetical protein